MITVCRSETTGRAQFGVRPVLSQEVRTAGSAKCLAMRVRNAILPGAAQSGRARLATAFDAILVAIMCVASKESPPDGKRSRLGV